MMCQPLQENLLLSNSAAWKQVVAGMYRPTLELVTYDMWQYYGLCCWLPFVSLFLSVDPALLVLKAISYNNAVPEKYQHD